jgi:hypothetical protein
MIYLLQKTVFAALLLILITIGVKSFQTQFVQIPVPTDVTPPLGHGREKLMFPVQTESKKPEFTEPVQVTYPGCMSFRHLENTIVTEDASRISLSDGEAIITTSKDLSCFDFGTVASQVDSVSLNENSITQAVVDKAANTITIRSLHKNTTVMLHVITVAAGHAIHPITLSDGQEITLPIRSNYRSLYLTGEQLDGLVKTSDFVSVVKASPVLQRMKNSYNKNDRRLYKTAEKTAAALRRSK